VNSEITSKNANEILSEMLLFANIKMQILFLIRIIYMKRNIDYII